MGSQSVFFLSKACGDLPSLSDDIRISGWSGLVDKAIRILENLLGYGARVDTTQPLQREIEGIDKETK